jgi:NADH dehydrogenase FAD-containing subunit
VAVADKPEHCWAFNVAYDKLVTASGAEPTTFGMKGVQEYAIFLREVAREWKYHVISPKSRRLQSVSSVVLEE